MAVNALATAVPLRTQILGEHLGAGPDGRCAAFHHLVSRFLDAQNRRDAVRSERAHC